MSFRRFSLVLVVALTTAGCSRPVALPLSATVANAANPSATAMSTVDFTAGVPCAEGLAKISQRQTAVPATKPTNTPLPPNFTPVPKPPTPTPGPAPTEDRVGFPKGYTETFKLMYVYDRPDNKQVRVACGNDLAMAWQPNTPFAYGSVIALTMYRIREENGLPLTDANGHFVLDVPTSVMVMRKEKGFGEAYAHLRTGEWEYAAYRPNGAVQTPPQGTYACAACHLALADAVQTHDWTFRTSGMFVPGRYLGHAAPISNEVQIASMVLSPRSMKVKVGTTVTWTNRETFTQVLSFKDASIISQTLKPGDQFQHTLDKPGRFEYRVSQPPHQLLGAIQVVQ